MSNRLKANIVEALEFLKCMYVKDLIPISVLEDELEVLYSDGDPDWEDEQEARPGQAWANIQGSAYDFEKPEPSQARPKLGVRATAGSASRWLVGTQLFVGSHTGKQ